jgi:hypothetical protein
VTLLLTLGLLACRSDKDKVVDTSTQEIDADADGVPESEDCNDADANAFPGNVEQCDGVDNDCNGEIDDGVGSAWYTDADGDGYGDVEQISCEQPAGTSTQDGDCDDAASGTYPGAPEQCDGVDQSCDGVVDEDVLSTWYADADGDRYGDPATVLNECDPPASYVDDNTDCDDSNADANPGRTEVCDLVDNNCDGTIDEGVELTFYRDRDEDGYGRETKTEDACSAPSGYVDVAGDCNDDDATLNPDTLWYIDYDGDSFGSSTYTTTSCEQPSGYVSDLTDCDDASAASYPGADEVCDGDDNDCDTDVDEDPIDGSTYYTDSDGDGYGDPDSTVSACQATSGTTSDSSDCDDTDATVYPGTTTAETPDDGVDQNCDGNDGCTDLDCDGLVDMVIADYYDGSSYDGDIYLYYNDGGGYSDADRDILTNSYGARDVEAADLDGDGYQDIVVASYYDTDYVTQSYVYWGSSTGYSDTNSTALDTYGSNDVEVGDLDGDGYKDLVFANYYGTAAAPDSTIYWGSSTGYSSSDSLDLETDGAWEVEISDLDSDGYDELVFAAYHDGSSYSTSSYIYWGGSSGFSTSRRTTLPTLGARGMEIADFDGDSLPDIAFSSYYNGSSYTTSAYVYYQSSSGTFGTGNRDSLAVVGAIDLSSGDYNGDGLTDLAFAGYYGGSWSTNTYVYVFENSSSGFGSATTLGGVGNWGLVSVDTDKDGYDELISPRYYDGSAYATSSYLWWGSASGLSDSNREDLPSLTGRNAAVGDVDADGYPEIVFSNYYSGSWSTAASSYLYFGSATGWSTSAVDSLSTVGTYGRPVFVGDSSW